LSPGSHGSANLREFIIRDGLSVWFMSSAELQRAFELMAQYADHPMDLADASLIVAAEVLRTTTIFTIDRGDFATYRIRRGHRYDGVEIIA